MKSERYYGLGDPFPIIMDSRIKWWLVVILMGFMSGCGGSIKISDLAGTYIADFGFATDMLIINPDNRYTQTIKIKENDKTAIVNGTWRFDEKNGALHFSAFMVVINGFSQMVTNFDDLKNVKPQIIGLRRRFGKIEIGGDDWLWGRTGIDAPYKKQASMPSK